MNTLVWDISPKRHTKVILLRTLNVKLRKSIMSEAKGILLGFIKSHKDMDQKEKKLKN